jgi:hypothetical protein
MNDFYLRFPDESAFLSNARSANAVVETEQGPDVQLCNFKWAMVLIGPIIKADEKGNVIQKIDGYHVNIRMIGDNPLPEEFLPYTIVPNNPISRFL